jgi:hypothetical protein
VDPNARKQARLSVPWKVLGLVLIPAVLASCGGGGSSNGMDSTSSKATQSAGASDNGNGNGPIAIRTVSNRADLVSDGDALMEVTASPGLAKKGLTVKLNGTDVTSAFVDQGKGRFLGVVTGMRVGSNVLQAVLADGHPQGAQLVVTNAPRSGPVLSGTQVTPYYCATPTPQPQSGNTPATNGSGLAGLPDANCNIATETKLYYRTTAPGSGTGACSTALPDPAWNSNGVTGAIPPQPLPPANPCWKPYTGGTPPDIATVTTDNGQTLPFIVRLERGTMNRGIYDIAVLFNPAGAWTAVAPQAQWNGKVYYSFGASTGQPRRQARSTATAWTALEEQLKRGWLVVSNSMSDSLRNSNRVLMTETVMMMKEHIVDTYGQVLFTLGTGCSGGSINSNMNLSIFPGNLDGVITSCTYPDSETTSMEVGDCTLLVEAYQKPQVLGLWSSLGLTQDQINARKAAINGHQDQTGCQAWFNLFGSNGKAGLYNLRQVGDQVTGAIVEIPGPTNNCELPNSAVYDPANPTATAGLPRCNAWSWAVSIWGQVPGSPAAKDTRDNVGIQYGLGALLAGKITAEEFVTLNEVIGGTDRDTTPRAQRSTADSDALTIAYRSGIVASGANLAKAAIIDMRGWDDSLITTPPGSIPFVTLFGIHHQWYSWAIRDRITRDAGNAGNQALWRFARGAIAAPPNMTAESFTTMDQWLTTLVNDNTGRSLESKVRAARPAGSADFCYLTSDASQTTKVFDQSVCDADPFLKPAASPRQVAGGPRSEDVLKCRLKPLLPTDYPFGTFTFGQFLRLLAVFPAGVCDWTRAGIGQQAAQSPLTFKAGPGGQPLGDAPTSSRL